ncbi:type I-E CRISPR-associated protein Cse2/CasB, partial [Streptomyces sp. IF17]|nr:type I-E CRISPR-associated protein Cse2/CasB [Streptomyces alkaliphilus]
MEERVTDLQKGYLADHAGAVACLARLRRGAGKLPADVPDLWGLSGDHRLYRALPVADPANERANRAAENAAHLALTLYALHQQSRRPDRMHLAGVELGEAVRRLMPPGGIDEPIRRRFVQVGSSRDEKDLAFRLREIVSLLRREGVPLDYALLADRLEAWHFPRRRPGVRQKWGRSFHAFRPRAADDPGTTASGDTGPRGDI